MSERSAEQGQYHRHISGDVVPGPTERCIDPDAGAHDVLVMPFDAAAGYALQIKVNAGLSSEYWQFDSDCEEIRDSLDEALDDMSDALSRGYREEHLRVVALVIAAPIPGGDS